MQNLYGFSTPYPSFTVEIDAIKEANRLAQASNLRVDYHVLIQGEIFLVVSDRVASRQFRKLTSVYNTS